MNLQRPTQSKNYVVYNVNFYTGGAPQYNKNRQMTSTSESWELLDKLAEQYIAEKSEATIPKTLLLFEKTGDLFAEPGVTHIAHCISADCVMGAGFAKVLVQRFGGASFRQRVGAHRPTIGDCVAVATEKGPMVYNLITKLRYNHKPIMPALFTTLQKMCNHAIANGIKTIHMPRIGCGLDRLNWSEVRDAVDFVFSKHGVQIVVIDTTPSPAPRSLSGAVAQNERIEKLLGKTKRGEDELATLQSQLASISGELKKIDAHENKRARTSAVTKQ
jgi:O-acetyl-ADP-ribose deacetylase (regulator of RNase III)